LIFNGAIMTNEGRTTGETNEPQDAHAQTDFDDEWMTIDQVAEHFGCPAARVREWIASGVLTPQPSGSIERIQRRELDRVGNLEQNAAAQFEEDHGN
jgi:hypothetical protein